jgi:hypothetical protein
VRWGCLSPEHEQNAKAHVASVLRGVICISS